MEENKTKTVVNGGIGFTSALQLLFIAFKLLNIIDWSWLWVLSPTWISVSLWVLGLVILLIIAAAVSD